ncbi:Serine/threonine protein kinase OSK1 [Dissostichus eleginoides]|uniref:Serine/threonine protein kinase OSK1 n=1 Tax=Dissostichus eleginoides TaxID=100907 RepID=A0AAD9C8M2_DISEL|nr:Serine/threonine protein kinase OSK1 [Dissostichus eleginoides]
MPRKISILRDERLARLVPEALLQSTFPAPSPGSCRSTKLSGHVQSPGVRTSLRLPRRWRLSKEGVDPGDLSRLPLCEKRLLHTLCCRVKWTPAEWENSPIV